MAKLAGSLREQMRESVKLDDVIKKNLKLLGFGQ